MNKSTAAATTTKPLTPAEKSAKAADYWQCKCGKGGRWSQWHYRFDH
jgi:hypothetical protein